VTAVEILAMPVVKGFAVLLLVVVQALVYPEAEELRNP